MENNQLDTTPKSAPVMDVQPPQAKAPDQIVAPTQVVPEAPSSEQPTAETPISTPPTALESADAPAPATEQPEAAQPLVAKSNGGHHKAPKGVILVAILVALGLGALSVIVYNKSNDGQNKSPTEQQATINKVADVTPDDVDATSKAVDESLNQVDETTEFDTNSLSDTSLQL